MPKILGSIGEKASWSAVVPSEVEDPVGLLLGFHYGISRGSLETTMIHALIPACLPASAADANMESDEGFRDSDLSVLSGGGNLCNRSR
jgi:hypothetical protein